uniref:Uncharacterized protein n=1 Tax=Daphnia magna TaxID=35525 RepID=A0A0P6IVN1_9CRUS
MRKKKRSNTISLKEKRKRKRKRKRKILSNHHFQVGKTKNVVKQKMTACVGELYWPDLMCGRERWILSLTSSTE